MSLSNATGDGVDGEFFPEINAVFNKILLPVGLESYPFLVRNFLLSYYFFNFLENCR